MTRSCNYAVIRFAANSPRNECLNIGLVVFHPDSVDVRLSKRLDKVHVISGALDIEAVRDAVLGLHDLDGYVRKEGHNSVESRLIRLASLAPVQFSDMGFFDCPTALEYESALAKLLQNLVEPEPAPLGLSKRRPSKLLVTLKKALRMERVLAKKGEDLKSHRVVSNYNIAEGLSADLVLKNGAMHIFEAVDVDTDDMPLRRIVSNIAVSALVFEQARMTFGDLETRARLIYRAPATAESLAKPSLLAAEHQGAELVNWESAEDRLRLISDVTALAEPLEQGKALQKRSRIHASTQHKFQLN